MKNYTFLFRTIFFIFSLIAAVWMVLQIEKLKPSDFGKYKSVFETPTKQERNRVKIIKMQELMKQYKAGNLSLDKLENELTRVINE